MNHEKGNDALVASPQSLFVFFTGSKIYVSQGWHKKLSSLENPYVEDGLEKYQEVLIY